VISMSSKASDAIASVFPRVLEEQTFLFADPSDLNFAASPPREAVCVSITFSGANAGKLEMGISATLGREIARNLLEIEPGEEPPDSAAQDALRELLNVTCGNILTEMAGDKPVFNLSLPQIEPIDAKAWKKLISDPGASIFEVENQPVVLRLIGHDT